MPTKPFHKANHPKTGRPPHPATVIARRVPHPAEALQPKRAFRTTVARPPHGATVGRGHGRDAGTVQRMELLREHLGGGFNPFARTRYTSCVCFVATEKDEAHITEAVTVTPFGFLNKFIGEGILSGMTAQWNRGGQRPFQFCCFNDVKSNDSGYVKLMNDVADGRLQLGQWPLFVVVGHTSPGSRTIEAVEHGTSYDCGSLALKMSFVLMAANIKYCTVFVSTCNSGKGSKEAPSFQESLDEALGLCTWNGTCFSIGTTSGSSPLPWIGKVFAEDFTFARMVISESKPTRKTLSGSEEQSEYDGVRLIRGWGVDF